MLTKTTSQFPSLLLLATFAVTGNAADSSTSGHPGLETLIVTATRTEQPLAQLSSSVSVVTQDDLLQVSAVHISELMVRVPGVWVSRGNGQESLTAIRSPVLTGAGSCGAFDIEEDGIPVRPTGFCNVNELFDINTEQAQRVEVIRGPGTVLHGSDALHGVINVISQAPVSDGSETLVSLEGGANDYGRIKLSQSGGDDRQGYRINFNGASDGGYKDNSGYGQQKLTARYDYHGQTWSSSSLLSGSNLNQETAGYVEGTDAYKDSSLKRYNPTPEAYRDSQAVRWHTRFQRDVANDGTFIVTPYARNSQMQFLMHFLPGKPVEENGQTSAGIQTAYRRQARPGLTLTQGMDVEWTDAYLKQTQDGGFSSFPAGKQYDYNVEARVLAAFLSGEYQWTPRTRVSLGARYERVAYNYDNRMISGDTDANGNPCMKGGVVVTCRYSRPGDRTDDFENLSADAGIVYDVSDSLILHARLSQGYRAPQATELYRLQVGQLQPNLDSERLNNVEAGLKGKLGSASYSLTGYYMSKSHVIFQSVDRLNVDNGRTRHYGLEYQLYWPFTESWDISASGTLARHKYASDVTAPGSDATIPTKGNDVDTAPHHMSTVELGWRPLDSTRVELEWVSMGRYYTDITNQHSYKGHNLLNLRLRQQLGDNTTLGLRINNLTNRDYAERADYTSFSGDRYFIGEPRSVFGDIEYRF